jgi:uncharacterized protein YqgQ
MYFNWEYYINKYEDLKKDKINTEEKALHHWLKHGKNEKRIYTDIPIYFDWNFYVKNNPELKKQLNTEDKAWGHFLYYGQYEKRYELFETHMKNMYGSDISILKRYIDEI